MINIFTSSIINIKANFRGAVELFDPKLCHDVTLSQFHIIIQVNNDQFICY